MHHDDSSRVYGEKSGAGLTRLKANGVEDIYSVSGCLSKDFSDYIEFWKHNSYWLFDSHNVIEQLAREQSFHLTGTTMFYYEVHEQEFDDAK